MKQNKYPQEQHQNQASASRTSASMDLNRTEVDLAPSPDEVARKAYFSYVNQGSQPGHEVQHWLAAESELIAERNRTRTHGFHNQT
jgi:hypothetical protein